MSPSTERANSEEMETNYPNFDDTEIVDTHEGNDDDYYYDDDDVDDAYDDGNDDDKTYERRNKCEEYLLDFDTVMNNFMERVRENW